MKVLREQECVFLESIAYSLELQYSDKTQSFAVIFIIISTSIVFLQIQTFSN